VEFRPPDDRALLHIADTMRKADVAEVKASSGNSPRTAISASVDLSDWCTVAWITGEPVVVFGLVQRDILSGIGYPWMLGSDGVLAYKRAILQHTPHAIRCMNDICPVLMNYVHQRNRASVRLLQWLGFTLEPAVPWGVAGEKFHKFHKERDYV
jgi:hypothetical protein